MRLLFLALLLILPLRAASVVDYFARVDGAGFGSTYWTVSSGSFSRGTSAMYGTSASASLAYHNGTTGLGTEQYGHIRVAAKSGSNGNSNYRGIAARVQTGSGDHYGLRIGDNSGTGHVVRVISGTPTTLTPDSGSIGGLDVGDILQWRVEGTGATVTITVRRYTSACTEVGSSPAIYTDTNAARIVSAGAAGMVAATSSSNFRIDDFYAGDIADGLPPCQINASGNMFISPSASIIGTGTRANPLTLHAAMYASGVRAAGTTFWIRGGTYGWDTQLHDDGDAHTISWSGSSGNRIRLNCYPGETCILDPNQHCNNVQGCSIVKITGSHVDFKGFEIRNSDTTKKQITGCGSNPGGTPIRSIASQGDNNRVLNCFIHNTAEGPGTFATANGGTWMWNLITRNGWLGPDRSHGHGIYMQNNIANADKLLYGNVSHGNMQFQGKLFSNSGGDAANFDVRYHVMVAGKDGAGTGPGDGNRGFDVQAGNVDNIRFTEPLFYTAEMNFNADVTIADGTVVNGGYLDGLILWQRLRGATFNGTKFSHWKSTNDWPYTFSFDSDPSADTCPEAFTMDNVTFVRSKNIDNSFSPGTTFAGFVAACSPTNTTEVTGVFPAYGTSPSGAATNYTYAFAHPEDPGMGRVVIYNWKNDATVNVDVSAILRVGDPYEIVDMQNYNGGPIATGIYNGGTLAFDTTLTAIHESYGNYNANPGLDCSSASDVSSGFFLQEFTSIVVDGSGLATATMTAPHFIGVGSRFMVFGVTSDTDLNSPTGNPWTILSIPTSSSATFQTTGVTAGTYDSGTDPNMRGRRGGTAYTLPNWKHTEQHFNVYEVRRRQVWANSTLKWKGASTDVIRYGLRNAAGAIVWDGPPAVVSCAGSDCEAEIPQPTGDVFYQINGSVAMKARL